MKIYKLFKLFLGKVKNKFLSWLSLASGFNFTRPDNIYYLISNRCNFRCEMCPQWQAGLQENVANYLTLEQIKKVIDQAKRFGVNSFGISGGEPFAMVDRVMEILAYANSKKMYTHFVTNGWLLTEEIIKRYDAIGGGHISISLDAASILHDQLRGTPGAFEHVKKAVEAYGRVKPKNILLKLNLVISDKNLDEVLNVVEFARKNGASLFVQPFDPYNWDNRKTLTLAEYRQNYPLWIKEENRLKLHGVIDRLLAIKKSQPSLIINSEKHLQAIPKYYNLELNRNKCYIGYRSFVIEPNGVVSVCKYGQVGDVKEQSVKQIWRSQIYNRVRKSALHCNFDCLLGCMYDPSIFSWIKSGVNYFFQNSNE